MLYQCNIDFSIIKEKVIICIISSVIIGLIFFIGYILNNSKGIKNPNAKSFDKQAYWISLSLFEEIKMIEESDVIKAKGDVSFVCEQLRTESDFGYGNANITKLENEILVCLEEVGKNIKALKEPSNLKQVCKNIENLCGKIISNLKLRKELTKK